MYQNKIYYLLSQYESIIFHHFQVIFLLKYSIKLLIIALFLTIISYPASAAYPYILVNGSALGESQLTIDVQPLIPKVGEKTTITVTSGIGAPQDNAELSFDGVVAGITDATGQLKYIPNHNGSFNITATKLGYEKAFKNIQVSGFMNNPMNIHCSLNESLIEHNIVIVIDASSSTMGTDPGSGISFIGLINANAINIVRNAGFNTGVGIVSFGGNISKTEILLMGSKANKAVLEDFIKEIAPKGYKNPTNLDMGLLSAQDLLSSVNGTREIIVISDGMLSKEGFDQLKKNVTNLKNRDIKTQFIQVLMSYTLIKEPTRLYNELANVSGGQTIVLNPDERVSTLIEGISLNEPHYEEPCSTSVDVMTTISVFTIDGNSIDGAEISLDDIPIGQTNETGMISFNTGISGLHNISATKSGYEKTMKMIEVLAAPTIAQNPSVTPNQTLIQESVSISNQSKEMSSGTKETPGFKGVFVFIVLLFIIMFRRVF